MFDLADAVSGNRRTAHEYVCDAIRVAILRGSVPGGTRLVQSDIARDLGVSTTPVREALRDLATEGLIDLDAHRGAVVKKLTYKELMEIHDLTEILDPEAVRLAASSPVRDHVDIAEQLASQMDNESDVGRWVDLNRQFHEAIVANVDNDRLLGILKGLRDSVAPYIGVALQKHDYFDEANAQHHELVDVVHSGDAERGFELAKAHVDLTVRVLNSARDLFE